MALKEQRKLKGLSQGKLAERCGQSVRTIQSYEQKTKDINKASLENLLNLAIALECKISDILTDNNLIEKCKKLGI